MAEKRTNADQASSPVPKARAAADPQPAKAAKAAKQAETAKPAKAVKATKVTKTAKATKATKATKTTQATKTAKAPAPKAAKQPAKKAAPPPAAPPPAATTPAAPGAWTAAVREALSQTDQPPQRLAELAVAELGPRAAAWAGWLRDTYPDPPAHGIARLATHQAREAGWALAFAEAGGPVTAALSLPAAAWVRATMVLRIAAAYGHDPADPQRAADLIELLDFATPHGRRRLVGFAAARFGVRRTLARAAVRMLLAAGDHGEQIERLAHRAVRFYRRSRAA
jgi:hypothetical protein